ncbi:MAG: hypothetical protein WBO16_12590 [Gammaproteobacteria bacterium]|jgi:hypothetical protein
MKILQLFSSIIIMLAATFTVNAGTRAVVEIEVIKGDNVEKSAEIITFDDKRARIDFVGEGRKVTDQTPYIMTLDGGDSWVMGDKPKNEFYCTSMQTEEFFKILGGKVTGAIDFFNVKAESPTVKKTLEQPGPEILGYKTTRVQIETHARAYTRLLFFKFEYKVKIVEDMWYAPELEIHPIRKKWLDALTQSGNNIIDQFSSDYLANLPGAVLKTQSVVDITNVRKDETKTQKENTIYTKFEELGPEELDKIFKMPKCEPMDEKEVEEKAKALFSAGRIML